MTMTRTHSARARAVRGAGARALAVAAGGSAAPALAHPGDHTMSVAEGLFHLLTEPDHLALILLAVGACWLGWRALRASRRDRR